MGFYPTTQRQIGGVKPHPTSEADAFLAQDLSALDPAQFRPLTWETAPKTARVNMRLPEPLLAALKTKAAQRGIPYQRLIRELLERGV